MIALKPRFLLLAAFCTFAAVQVTAVPLDERTLAKTNDSSNGTSSHHRHATNGTSGQHEHKAHVSVSTPDKRRKGKKHHGREEEVDFEALASDSYQVSPRDPHSRHYHHHHHDKREEGELDAPDPRDHQYNGHVEVEGGDAYVHLEHDELQSRDPHHRDHDGHRHHHHSRSEYTVFIQNKESDTPEKSWDPLDPLIQVGNAQISDGAGPTYANTHPILGRRDNAQTFFHTKRGEMGGVPGTVDIVMVNPSPQRIASLVMTPQNSSSSDNSTVNNSSDNSTDANSAPAAPFVLDASNSTQTEFFMTPVSLSNLTNSTSNLPANNVMVSLQVPVFEPSTVSLSSFCATYDPNPSDPVPIGMQECADDLMAPAADSSTHASQAFLYDTDTGVVSPMWFTSGGNSSQTSQEAVSRREFFADDLADGPESDEFFADDTPDSSSPTDSADPVDATATMTSSDPASSDASSSTTSTDSSEATPTDMSSTSTDTQTESATATTDEPSTTASSTTSTSTSSATASGGSDGGISPQDVTLVFTPSGPAVPMGEGIATSFQPLDGGNPSSSSTDQRPDDATTQSQTPISTEASATPTSAEATSTSTDDSVGTASNAMPTASSLSSSDAPTSTADDSESTMTATGTDSMATSTMSLDDSFVSSSMDSASTASATGDAAAATGTATEAGTATETDGSMGAPASASPTSGSLIVDSDSIEQMFNAQ